MCKVTGKIVFSVKSKKSWSCVFVRMRYFWILYPPCANCKADELHCSIFDENSLFYFLFFKKKKVNMRRSIVLGTIFIFNPDSQERENSTIDASKRDRRKKLNVFPRFWNKFLLHPDLISLFFVLGNERKSSGLFVFLLLNFWLVIVIFINLGE